MKNNDLKIKKLIGLTTRLGQVFLILVIIGIWIYCNVESWFAIDYAHNPKDGSVHGPTVLIYLLYATVLSAFMGISIRAIGRKMEALESTEIKQVLDEQSDPLKEWNSKFWICLSRKE